MRRRHRFSAGFGATRAKSGVRRAGSALLSALVRAPDEVTLEGEEQQRDRDGGQQGRAHLERVLRAGPELELGSGTQYPLKMGAALLTTIPVALLFFTFQRYFVRGANEGAEKG